MATNTQAWDPGDTVRLTFIVTSSTGDSATDYVNGECQLVINRPTGAPIIFTSTSTASVGLTHVNVGRYQAEIVPGPAEYGRWTYQFTVSSPIRQSDSGAFAVRPLRALP